MQSSKNYRFKYKGFYFQPELVTAEYLDSLEDFEIRDSDVFLVTYPKSGTVWTQNILNLIHHEGHRDGTEDTDSLDRVPCLEYNIRKMDYISRPSPRLFASHLPYYLVPKGLRNRRAKIWIVPEYQHYCWCGDLHCASVELDPLVHIHREACHSHTCTRTGG
ncbi:amine sulfotransferase-like [Sphaerodactylus townsendi]|uniref:amine sulfotransferase-like n=1 Tax=Sphaerodactylus townsendi TaxID=933632 RepID=UPI0020274E6B|nr:amine sulfotransferase-like [Sphaerodactylus townsendi]